MITPTASSARPKSQQATCVTATPATSSARSTAASIAGSTPPSTPITPSRPAVSSTAGTVKPGSMSRMPSSTAAMSRPIGPTVSSDGASGYTPFTDTRPHVVFSPVTPQQAAGMRTEPPVSVPKATSASPVATATADPLEEPPGTRRGSLGFTGVPAQWFTPLADQHSSVSPVFPAIRAPCSRADATTAASLAAGSAISATTGHPAVVGTPATSMQSLTASRGPAPSGAIRTIHVPMTP
jgi:hypothetical protein